MLWIFLLFVLPALLATGWAVYELKYADRGFYSDMGMVCFLFCLIVFCWVVITPAIYYGGRAVDRSNCKQDGLQMKRTTKFKQYNAFTWKCLVKTDHGYIDIERLNGFDNAN